MLLRDIRPDDLAAVHLINEAEVPAVGSETHEALERINQESVISLVAADPDTGEIGAFCMVLGPQADYGSGNFIWFRDRYDRFVYLDRIAVAPSFRRRGIGSAMYAEVERLAAERAPDAIDFCLEVNLRPHNEVSLAFHAELGFTEVGQRETSYGARVSLMTKTLRTEGV